MTHSVPAASGPIRCTRRGNILVVQIDNPPVNALGAEVRRGLVAAIESAEANSEIAAIVIAGAGRMFIGGADIKEFGNPRAQPILPEVCARIESCTKLVIAALHGAALGGGLELALSAHYRVALREAEFALPEVKLGLLPGAGGTQRTPRVAGVRSALDLILTGRRIGTQEARRLGLVDSIADGEDPVEAGLNYAHELVDRRAPLRRTRDFSIPDRAHAAEAIRAAREGLKTKNGQLVAPSRIVDAIEAAFQRPFTEGMAAEREAYLACQQNPQHPALVHAFFAERQVLKAPETHAAIPRAIQGVGVVGGGTMGAGIAVALLDAGLPVTMVERDQASLERGRGNVERLYQAAVAKGRLEPGASAERLARLTASLEFDALNQADLVIEAAFEDMQVKHEVFSELDRVCRPGAILASNTSYLDLNSIGERTSRPQDVIGLHFFSPANVMRLLEIVVPDKAAADVVATGFALAKALGKLPVRAGVCDGFIGNRIFASYRLALDFLLEDGASPYEIDEALREFGFPMGPFQVMDLAGGDIGWATRKRRAATRSPQSRYVAIADRLCERGWFGQKTGRGWYVYSDGSRTGTPDPEVLSLVAQERARAGITPRRFDRTDIVRRFVAAIVNEGAKVVQERIALRPLDVDVTFVHGYGFPRYRGGPMKYADFVGLEVILNDIEEFSKEDGYFWRPATLLQDLVHRGQDFDALNRQPLAPLK